LSAYEVNATYNPQQDVGTIGVHLRAI